MVRSYLHLDFTIGTVHVLVLCFQKEGYRWNAYWIHISNACGLLVDDKILTCVWVYRSYFQKTYSWDDLSLLQRIGWYRCKESEMPEGCIIYVQVLLLCFCNSLRLHSIERHRFLNSNAWRKTRRLRQRLQKLPILQVLTTAELILPHHNGLPPWKLLPTPLLSKKEWHLGNEPSPFVLLILLLQLLHDQHPRTYLCCQLLTRSCWHLHQHCQSTQWIQI